jgi:hypothetical protein
MMTFAVALTCDPRRSRRQAPKALLDELVSFKGLISCPPGNMASLRKTLDFIFPGRSHSFIRTSRTGSSVIFTWHIIRNADCCRVMDCSPYPGLLYHGYIRGGNGCTVNPSILFLRTFSRDGRGTQPSRRRYWFILFKLFCVSPFVERN